jgi:UDP-glucose 4-epimerase
MKTIVVTGGAGYIGSHTIIELLENTNHRVVSIDNYSNSTASTYDRIAKICSRSFEKLEIDLCNELELNSALNAIGKIDGIIHFAAFKSVPDSMADPIRYYTNNNNSLINLLAFCKTHAINTFIFSSSCSVYGNTSELPVTESTPWAKAESSYGHTKQMGEDIIHFFSQAQRGFSAILLRYFNPVGAHMSGLNGELPLGKPNNLVPIITQTAVGKNALTVFGDDYATHDGTCIRDFIHVSDIADAHVKALNHLLENKNTEPVSVYNLGTGQGVSVLEAIKSFEKVSQQKLPYTIGARRNGDVIAIYANNNKVQQDLNWVPKFSLDDMMSSAWKWQLQLEKKN